MNEDNPLLREWDGPHGLPPFGELAPTHFAPALQAAMRAQREELAAIAANPEAADFENTAAAFDRSGRLLDRIEAVFHCLAASATGPELQAVQREMAAPLAAHHGALRRDPALFARLDAVHAGRAALAPVERRLIERLHLDFVRAGARLAPAAQRRYGELTEELATLTTRFAQNLLHDEAEYGVALAGEADLAGLPDALRAGLREAARARGQGGHLLTLSRSAVVGFLTFSQRRDLRERVWRAWDERGAHAGEHDNRELLRQILALRSEQARAHGHGCYADYALEDTMAGTHGRVDALIDEVWPRALAACERDRARLQQVMAACGAAGPIEEWDWRYWAEKVRARHYAIDDAELRAYFPLARVVEAAFDCAERLFGLRFEARADWPVYHPEVRAYEVIDARSGLAIGVFMQDNFARAGKRSGAWMSALRRQSRHGGARLPIILNNNNFAVPSAQAPALLSLDEARTLFHEFGHALHGLLSDVEYARLAGTQVLRDFVELPSQLFEHWITEPAVLRRHARHWRSGEPIPQALIERLQAARCFDEGWETLRYLASAIVDMSLHALPAGQVPQDPGAFELELLRRRGLPAGVGQNHRAAHFQHLFAGSGYAAGYYVYLWADTLAADAHEAFIEAGDPFDPPLAAALRRWIYASGNSIEPGAAFAEFRGRAPAVGALLRERGFDRPMRAGASDQVGGGPNKASIEALKAAKSSGLVQ